MVSSDDKGCAEAAALIPGVKTAVVKTGMGRYIGRLKHPSVTGPLIEETAGLAVSAASDVAPWQPVAPVTVRLEQHATEQADVVALLAGWTRIDAYTLEFTAESWELAHSAARRAMATAGQGASGNQ